MGNDVAQGHLAGNTSIPVRRLPAIAAAASATFRVAVSSGAIGFSATVKCRHQVRLTSSTVVADHQPLWSTDSSNDS